MGKLVRVKKFQNELLKLDFGCGQNKREGFIGVDKVKTRETDIVVDLFEFPWPWKDASVQEIHCSHFFEHIPGRLRAQFMNEAYRILAFNGIMTVISPYYSSMRAIQDYTHEWPPICEASFLYFNKGFREGNKLTHYNVTCDFDFTYGYVIDNEVMGKQDDVKAFWLKHYLNTAGDLQVTLTKVKREKNENAGGNKN